MSTPAQDIASVDRSLERHASPEELSALDRYLQSASGWATEKLLIKSMIVGLDRVEKAMHEEPERWDGLS